MNDENELIKTEQDLPLKGGIQLRVQRLQWTSPAGAERPTLVFLHDSLGCIVLWRDFPEQLARACACNVLVYDRQGYGQSSSFTTTRTPEYLEQQAPVLEQVLAHCNINKAVLFGHSDGGTIALIAAARYPRQISAIITEGAHVFVEEVTLAGIREAAQAFDTTPLEQRLARYHGHKTRRMFAAWTETWLSAEFREWNIEEYLPHIKCPVLVIQGEQDEYGTQKQVDAIVAQVKGPAEKYMVPRAGHTPHKEFSEEVLTATVKFLKRNGIGNQ